MTKNDWQLEHKFKYQHDPLLGCLNILLKIEHKAFVPESLISGLPLEENALTPGLFIRAAAKANISANIVERSIDKISSLVLPVVLLLKNKQCLVLLKKLPQDKVQVINPETAGVKTIHISDLAGEYSGYAIFTKTKFEFDDRSETVVKDGKNWFWPVIKQSWQIYAEVIVASLFINLFAVVSPLFTMNVYDRVVPNKAFDTLYVLVAGITIAYVFDFIMKMLRGYFIDLASKRADIIMSAKIFSQMIGLRLESRPESVGSFASSVQQFEGFRDFFTSATISAIIDAPFVILFLGLIYYIGGEAVIVPLCVIPIVIIAGLIIQKPLVKVVKESYRYSTQKQAMLIESISCLDSIKINLAQGSIQKKWEQAVGMSAKLSAKIRMLALTATSITAFAGQMANVGIILIGVHKISNGEITMGALIACTILCGRALAPLSQVANLLTRYHQAITALESVDKMMQMPSEGAKTQSPLYRPVITGNITFDKVSFAYPKQQNPAIRNISFKVNSGEKIAIIGKIGSGKTTLQKLILGLYQASEGNILIDGTEVNQLDVTCLRKNIGYVPQDIELHYGSIKDNIKMGAPYIDDETVLESANVAGIADFIAKSPMGFDTPVGERGIKLSGGQRQAIALARAMIFNPNILLFDEPTNMFDTATEDAFKRNLCKKLDNKTLILVTHKGSMLSIVDRIIVLDEGALVIDGPRDKVLKYLSELKQESKQQI